MKVILFLFFILISSCNDIPDCPECKVYAGNSDARSVERRQDNEEIQCASPKFDEMLCFTNDGFTAFVETYINGCRQWNTRRTNKRFWKRNEIQLKRLLKKK